MSLSTCWAHFRRNSDPRPGTQGHPARTCPCSFGCTALTLVTGLCGEQGNAGSDLPHVKDRQGREPQNSQSGWSAGLEAREPLFGSRFLGGMRTVRGKKTDQIDVAFIEDRATGRDLDFSGTSGQLRWYLPETHRRCRTNTVR